MSRFITAASKGRAAQLRLQRGLTVVELFIAVCIAAVLLSLAVPAYQNYRERLRIDQAKRDIATMSGIIASFYYDARAYPDTLADAGLGAMPRSAKPTTWAPLIALATR